MAPTTVPTTESPSPYYAQQQQQQQQPLGNDNLGNKSPYVIPTNQSASLYPTSSQSKSSSSSRASSSASASAGAGAGAGSLSGTLYLKRIR